MWSAQADPLVALAPPTLQVEVCLELHTPHPTQDDNRLTEGSWAQQKRGWGGAGGGCRCCRPRAVVSLCLAKVLLWQLVVAQPSSRVAATGG